MHCRHRVTAALVTAFCITAALGSASAQQIEADPELKAKLPETVRSTGKLVIAAFPNAPFIVQEENNVVTGAAYDLGAAIGQILGLPTEQAIVASTAASRVGVQSGRYNLTMGPNIDTADTEKEVDIIPWVKTSPGFVYRAQASFGTVLDFCGKAFGIVSGSIPAERNMQALSKACVAAGKPEQSVSGFGDQNAMILGVEAGRVDAALVSSATGLYIEKVRAGRLKAFVADSDIFGIGQYSGAVTRKGDPLSEILLAAMAKLQATRVYDAIMEKYNIKSLRVDKMALNPQSGK
jgi:polar amino acid transport system substrate-binding protein